jgi:hypothetical protein
MARSSECKEQYAQKTLDTADIVREACSAFVNLFVETCPPAHERVDPLVALRYEQFLTPFLFRASLPGICDG